MGAARSRLELDGADLEERELVERRVDHRVGAAAIRLAREVMRTSPSAHPVARLRSYEYAAPCARARLADYRAQRAYEESD